MKVEWPIGIQADNDAISHYLTGYNLIRLRNQPPAFSPNETNLIFRTRHGIEFIFPEGEVEPLEAVGTAPVSVVYPGFQIVIIGVRLAMAWLPSDVTFFKYQSY